MTHDNWSYKLTAIKDDMLLTVGNDILKFGPVLQGIFKSFMNVRENYMTYGDNFINVPILGNPNFRIKCNEPDIFDYEFFTTQIPALGHRTTAKLTWAGLIQNDHNFKSPEHVNESLGVNVPFRAYIRLKSGYLTAKKNKWEKMVKNKCKL
jgi:hypothetical protein